MVPAETLSLIKRIVMIRRLIPGTTLQSPICLRAERLPRPALTTAAGSLPGGTSTSPSALARFPGTRLPTHGAICRTWNSLAITSLGQPRANPSTPLPAPLHLALGRMTTSNTSKPSAGHRLLRPHQVQAYFQLPLRVQRHQSHQ